MRMKLLVSLPFIVVVVWNLTTARPATADVDHMSWLQGTWHMNGYADQKKRRGQWFLEWTFAGGKFKENGYPPLAQSGSYRVLSTQGDKVTLELYAQKGTFGTKNSRLDIVVYEQKDQLKIGTNGPFSRVGRPVRQRIETTFSQVEALLLRHVHGVTARGFVLKALCFHFAVSFRYLQG